MNNNTVSTLTGKLLICGKTEDKTNKNGNTYKIQKCKIDREGKEVWVSVFGGGVNWKEKGNIVTFSPGDGPKQTITFSEQYGYTVSEGCTIEHESNGSQSHEDAPGLPLTQFRPHNSAPTIKELLDAILSVHLECDAAIRQNYPDVDAETHRTYTASLFIEANKQGAHKLVAKW